MNGLTKYVEDADEYLDKKEIQSLRNALEHYPSVPHGMTQYQIEMFVLQANEFPTWYAVYHQCVLEGWTRFTNVLDTLDQIEETRLKCKLYRRLADRCLTTKADEVDAVRAELYGHKIRVKQRNIEITKHKLHQTIRELQIFEKIRLVAEEKLNGKVPDFGDMDEESKKWYIKFTLNQHPMRTSLVAGKMDAAVEGVVKYLNDLSPEERSILNADVMPTKPNDNVKRVQAPNHSIRGK